MWKLSISMELPTEKRLFGEFVKRNEWNNNNCTSWADCLFSPHSSKDSCCLLKRPDSNRFISKAISSPGKYIDCRVGLWIVFKFIHVLTAAQEASAKDIVTRA